MKIPKYFLKKDQILVIIEVVYNHVNHSANVLINSLANKQGADRVVTFIGL